MSLFPTIPPSLVRFLHRHLYAALPPVPGETDEEREERHLAFMAAVVRLAPMNTGEAMLAIHAIATEAHALDALHGLHRAGGDWVRERQCRAQSCAMMRQGMQARKTLERMQEERRAEAAWADQFMEQSPANQFIETKTDAADPAPGQEAGEASAGVVAEADQDMGRSPGNQIIETKSGRTASPIGPFELIRNASESADQLVRAAQDLRPNPEQHYLETKPLLPPSPTPVSMPLRDAA